MISVFLLYILYILSGFDPFGSGYAFLKKSCSGFTGTARMVP